MTDDIKAYDVAPCISMFYKDVDSDFKIDKLDTSYFDYERVEGVISCPRLKAVFPLLCENFELYYATREIGGDTEYDFFQMMQSCLNRNADTLERQLSVYDDDIANPILGRTEKVTYDTHDDRTMNNNNTTTYNTHDDRTVNLENEISYASGKSSTESGNDIVHHVEVPADNDEWDTDRSRDKTEYGHVVTDANTGKDTGKNTGTDKLAKTGTESDAGSGTDNRAMTGTVTTELSDLGVRPNYESLNGFLDNNRTFIQEFINVFEECFAPRYQRVIF